MEKQIKKFKVPYHLEWIFGVSIEQIRKDLDELEKLGVTEIYIESLENWGCSSVLIEAYAEREETDLEYENRINKETYIQEKIKVLELKRLEELKLKYGL
jgi:DeoR/GlpR family transcriptional regulator of sugar metabolism